MRESWAHYLRLERLCRVWQADDGSWRWRCSLCSPEPCPFTGRAWSHPLAYADADEHMRVWHTHAPARRTEAVMAGAVPPAASVAPVALREVA